MFPICNHNTPTPTATATATAKEVLLAHCETLSAYANTRNEFKEELAALLSDDVAIVSRARSNMGKLMRHAFLNEDGRRFFLPPFAEFKGGVIDFVRLALHDYKKGGREALSNARLFSLSASVSAELATRFARYMSRLGQAPYQDEPVLSSLTELAQSLAPPKQTE